MKVIDRRYLQRAIQSFNKTIRIRHEEDRYDKALHVASFHLNPLGMDQYYKCIKELVNRRDLLEMDIQVEDETGEEVVVGVTEKYKNVEQPIRYDTYPDQCTCKRYIKKGICLHILFLRENQAMEAFEKSLFMRFRYLRNFVDYDSCDDNQSNLEVTPPENEPQNADVYEDDIKNKKTATHMTNTLKS